MDRLSEYQSEDDKMTQRIANDNTYDIVTGLIRVEDLFNDRGKRPLTTYNPLEPELIESIYEGLIDYYMDIEEYERCAQLKLILQKKEWPVSETDLRLQD